MANLVATWNAGTLQLLPSHMLCLWGEQAQMALEARVCEAGRVRSASPSASGRSGGRGRVTCSSVGIGAPLANSLGEVDLPTRVWCRFFPRWRNPSIGGLALASFVAHSAWRQLGSGCLGAAVGRCNSPGHPARRENSSQNTLTWQSIINKSSQPKPALTRSASRARMHCLRGGLRGYVTVSPGLGHLHRWLMVAGMPSSYYMGV